MPIYEYKCQECGKVTEVFVRSHHQELNLSCSECKSEDLQKIFSTPSVVTTKNSSPDSSTCCGSTERCDTPPCSDEGTCRRD
ncbi:MAG: zinc ribbon domain-containing protein [Candidatus Aminicenantes bacterium]|nr:zinc ribbon domain-containing protein [Candidatus Aminicenantes bacterium]